MIYSSLTSQQIEIPYGDADEAFSKLFKKFPNHFLLESQQVSLFSGRFSLIGLDAALHLIGKDDSFEIKSLNDRGEKYMELLTDELFPFSQNLIRTQSSLKGTVAIDRSVVEESQRCQMSNISQVIKVILKQFEQKKKTLHGLYGAFSYDFIRLFEDINSKLPENETPDFSLMLFDRFVSFDHIKEKAEIITFDFSEALARDAVNQIEEKLKEAHVSSQKSFSIQNDAFSIQKGKYVEMVQNAKQLIQEGEIFQVVFSNILKADFTGDPYTLYKVYRKINPSPYLYFYDFGDEQLVGASPEMMVRYEEEKVHLRPIAGTVPRGVDPLDDHDHMLELLNDPKERAELDMLIDLGRNDLSRICKPGIEISDYRFVEKYSRVMHTVAHLTGVLKEGYSGLDALSSCLNAGTLTGSPKVAAMKVIENSETERRGYYGGAVGQLSFSGEVDTAIMIRTAHIKNGQLRYQSGAGIVYDSDPEKEYREILHKAKAFLEALEKSTAS